ncbi:MAG: redox-sensing transcriptional repressor Rex [Candidatus Omnitrophota bacterium]
MFERTINRICGYKNALYRFKKLGFVRVFSDNLSDAVGVTPSQVRKDFSMFAISGNKRGGYKVDELLEKICFILGKDDVCNVVVVGAGNIGLALMKYGGFEKENMTIKAAFDIDPAKFSEKENIPVLPLSELAVYVKKEDIKVGIIAVPDIAAQHVADLMVAAGVRGILNFAPILLRCGGETVVKNVNLELELENIIYFVNAREKKGTVLEHETKQP